MKRQYASIDIARYVSALLVVCIHTFPFLEISETFNTYFIHTVCRLAVPFFLRRMTFLLETSIQENEDLNETVKEGIDSFISNLFDLDNYLFAIYDF